MPRNGSGSYTLPQPPFTPGTTILSAAVNSDLSDIGSALTQSVSSDGQTTITGILKGSITTGPIYASSTDSTTGLAITAVGEADLFAGGTKILATTSTGVAVTGNISATGTLAATGTTTLGTLNVTTETITGILTDSNTGYWVPPAGNNAARPGSPSEGWSRYNSQIHAPEFWNGTIWASAPTFTTPNVQPLLSGSSATYTTPTNSAGNLPIYLRIRMVGAGGGGAARQTNNGGNGNTTQFESWTAIGGNGGVTNLGAGGTGGSGGANGTGTVITRVSGAQGQGGQGVGGVSPVPSGGAGGSSVFGGAGSGQGGAAGTNAATNSGSGGAGGSTGGQNTGGGGGAGEFVEFIMTSPAASYTYTVGTQGGGGAAGGSAGGNGGDGRIDVIAYWQ